jgi:peptide/nickel transport system substrate-binding protein
LKHYFIAAAGLAGVFLSACHPAASRRPVDRASLVVTQQREPISLNPALENGASSTEWGELVFQYLVKYDDRDRLIGDAAIEAPSTTNGGISADGKTITYHLRPGLRFSDGVPLTAADCVWSIEAVMNPRNDVQTRFGYSEIARAEAPNPATLVLHLRRPFAPVLTSVLAPQGFPILPKHVLASSPDFNAIPFDQQPVGSGPYAVVRWQHGDRVVLRANPYYRPHPPRVARLEIRFVPDANTAIDLLRTGETGGYFNDQDFGNYPTLRSLPGVRVLLAPVNAVGSIVFNTADPVTVDDRVRRALAAAIDIPALVRKTYRNAFDSTNAGRGLFIWAFDPKAYPDVAYDPAESRRLLDAAGWRTGPDGVREKDGRRLDVLFIIQAGTPGDAIIGNAVADYERAVGAAVTLKAFNITQFAAPAQNGGPVYGGKFQMALYPFVNGDDPDTTDQFACANVPPRGYNKSRICDPRIDALLRFGQSTFDPRVRKNTYARLERILSDRLPILLLYQRRELDAFDRNVAGVSPSVDSVFWNAGSWYVSP